MGPFEVGTRLIAVHRCLLSSSINESFLHVQTIVFSYTMIQMVAYVSSFLIVLFLSCVFIVVPSFNLFCFYGESSSIY